MKFRFLFLFLAAFISRVDLHAQKAKRKNEHQCQQYGKVRDYSNAIDCGYLIETEDGKLILPLEIRANDPSYRMGPHQIVKFDYKPMKNTSTLCMVEAQTAEITCLQLLPNYPKECLDVDVAEGGWIMGLIEQNKPHTIRKYFRESDIIYVFESPEEKSMFDCMGNNLCRWDKKQKNKCRVFPSKIGKLIYQWEKSSD